MDQTYVTQERCDELKKELTDLKTKGRLKVAKRLKQAKELGDLSENSEYQEAREEQTRLESRIVELEDLLRKAVIIKKTSGSQTVRIGSVVKVKKGRDSLRYTIVGANEAQPDQGLISNESPLGRALLGKKEEDNVNVETPKGAIKYHILSIE